MKSQNPTNLISRVLYRGFKRLLALYRLWNNLRCWSLGSDSFVMGVFLFGCLGHRFVSIRILSVTSGAVARFFGWRLINGSHRLSRYSFGSLLLGDSSGFGRSSFGSSRSLGHRFVSVAVLVLGVTFSSVARLDNWWGGSRGFFWYLFSRSLRGSGLLRVPLLGCFGNWLVSVAVLGLSSLPVAGFLSGWLIYWGYRLGYNSFRCLFLSGSFGRRSSWSRGDGFIAIRIAFEN